MGRSQEARLWSPAGHQAPYQPPGASVSRLPTSPELVSQRALHKQQLCPSCTLVIPSLCQAVWLGGRGAHSRVRQPRVRSLAFPLPV